jgi:predicted MFS family arabinose efflux permease
MSPNARRIVSLLGMAAFIGLVVAAAADALVFVGGSSLVLTTVGIFLLGFGFMTAHSTLLTVATEFAERAQGTAMSLVTFAFMVGGAIGTQMGGRVAQASSLGTLYAVYGAGLLVLAVAMLPALLATDRARQVPATQAA